MLNQTFQLYTDYLLAIFDPVIAQYTQNHNDLEPFIFDVSYQNFPEVNEGLISLFSVNMLKYPCLVRITDGELTADEKDFVTYISSTSGVTCKSGKIYIADDFPAYGELFTPENPRGENSGENPGVFIDLPVDEYNLNLYLICPEGFVEQEIEDTIPTLVLVIKKRTEKFIPPTDVLIPQQESVFLFPSVRNQQPMPEPPPEVGLVITGVAVKVDKIDSSELKIRFSKKANDWPANALGYSVELDDMTQIQWMDRVKFKVTSVDIKNKILFGKFIERMDT